MRAQLLALILAVLASGCVAVRPWEREFHARKCMTQGFGEDGLSARYRPKVAESKTGGGAPWSVPGGGCGCTQ